MHVFLVTVREINLDIALAFIVYEVSRNRAKALVERYCAEKGLSIGTLHTHDLGNEGVIRIDHLLL